MHPIWIRVGAKADLAPALVSEETLRLLRSIAQREKAVMTYAFFHGTPPPRPFSGLPGGLHKTMCRFGILARRTAYTSFPALPARCDAYFPTQFWRRAVGGVLVQTGRQSPRELAYAIVNMPTPATHTEPILVYLNEPTEGDAQCE